MFPSAGLGLLTFLRHIRTIGSTLKRFILRCLLSSPQILRSFRNIWSLFFKRTRTIPKDIPKKGGQARPPFPRTSACGGYSTISASRDFSDPLFPLGSDDPEVLHSSPIVRQSQSVPPSPTSSNARSTPASPQDPEIQASLEPHLRPSSPSPHADLSPPLNTLEGQAASPGHSPPQSPSLSPPLSLPEEYHSLDVPEVSIRVSLPSRPHSVEARLSQSPLSLQRSLYQLPTAGDSIKSLRPIPNILASSSQQARTFHSYSSQVNVDLPNVDASGNWSDGKTRSIGLMHSDQVSRYVNKSDNNRPRRDGYRLRPMEVSLSEHSQAVLPNDWAPTTHPDGTIYFYHAEWRAFTDVNMNDPTLGAEIQTFAIYLARTRPGPLPTMNYDLVLDIINMNDDEIIWAYYYVDHNTRMLFWQDPYECGDGLMSGVRGIQDGHVKLRLESLYWVHWSIYPTGFVARWFPQNALNELLGALLSNGIDSLTSKVLISPFTMAEIESMRDFIKAAESLDPENPHMISSVARLLSFYAHWKFLHFHGQKTSRQVIDHSIAKGGRRRRTSLIRIYSPILFYFPDTCLQELEKMLVDDVVVEYLWKEFRQKLVSEWADFILYSTVMLAANMLFLSVPGIVSQNTSPSHAWINPSPAQVTSFISLIFSIGSIITGLLLIRHHRTDNLRSSWFYRPFTLLSMNNMELLAIVLSLTYALLMWSVVGLFVALLIFSFQHTSKKIAIPVGIVAGVVIIFMVLYIIINIMDPGEQEEELDWPQIKVRSGSQVL